MNTKIERAKQDTPVVINNLTLRTVNRVQPEIDKWRTYHKVAEYIEHPSRVNLYDLYDDILLDLHLSGIIGKRLRSVRNKKIRFVKDGKEVAGMEDFIKSKSFRFIRKRIFDSLAWGLSGLEFVPGEKVTVREIPRKHIKPHLKCITKEQNGRVAVEGGYYNENPMLFVMDNTDDPLGFLLKVCPYVIFKRGAFGDWAEYIEMFGRPSRVYKYEPGDEQGRQQLEEVVKTAGAALDMMLPKTVDYQPQDGKNSNGDGQLQERFKNACDEQLSIGILGQTETTKSSGSSGYAQSKTHEYQQLEITQDDMDYELDHLNDEKFLSILQSYGLPADGRFEHEQEADPEKLIAELEIDSKFPAPLADDYFYEKYKRPKPANYDALKAEKLAQQTSPSPKIEKEQEDEVKPPKSKEKGQTVEDLMEEASEGWMNRLRHKLADFFDPPR